MFIEHTIFLFVMLLLEIIGIKNNEHSLNVRDNNMQEKNIRKIVKNGRDSYYINIPKTLIRELKWKEKQKVVVKKRGKGISVGDWKK